MGACLRKHVVCCGRCEHVDMDTKLIRAAKIPMIWMVGTPSTGKTTNSLALAKHYNLVRISPNDLMEAEIECGTDVGKLLTDKMDKGESIPTDMVMNLLKKAIVIKLSWANGFIFDDFPRTMEEAAIFEKQISPVAFIMQLVAHYNVTKNRAFPYPDPDHEAVHAFQMAYDTEITFTNALLTAYPLKVVQVSADNNEEMVERACILKVLQTVYSRRRN